MTLAFTMLGFVSNRRLRTYEGLLMLAALTLSASRISILALLFSAFALLLLLAFSSTAERQRLFTFAGLAFLCVAALLPWQVDDPESFTRRGGIWIACREVIISMDWLGELGRDL